QRDGRIAVKIHWRRESDRSRIAAVPYGSRDRGGIGNSPVDDLTDWIVAAGESPCGGRSARDGRSGPGVACYGIFVPGCRIELPQFLAGSCVVRCDVTPLLWRRTAGASGNNLVS